MAPGLEGELLSRAWGKQGLLATLTAAGDEPPRTTRPCWVWGFLTSSTVTANGFRDATVTGVLVKQDRLCSRAT